MYDSAGRKRTKQLSATVTIHGIEAKLVPNWEQNMLYIKSKKILCQKLEAFYVKSPKLELNFEDLEMQK